MQNQVKIKSAKNKLCPRFVIGTICYLFFLFFLLFLVSFLIIPIVFKYSIEIQRSLIFPTWLTNGKTQADFESSSNLIGVKNFYVTVDKENNITLGVWHILPNEILSEFINDHQYDYDSILKNNKFDILLFLHGNGADRSQQFELYAILRKYFQIIAFDYRGYADSSQGILTEHNIVNDTINLVTWIRNRSNAQIYFWGHSLGTAVSTHSISNLKNQNFTPSGLVLETPFTSVVDVVERNFFVKFYSWLPWYENTLIDPFVENGFEFNSQKYITDVDCPIMILHAKDDTIIPYDLATRLYATALYDRNLTVQGNVTYHLFEAKGYDHMYIYQAPELPSYVRDFIKMCRDFRNMTN